MASVLPSRRVLITGIGLITPLGLSTPETWAALIAGKSAIRVQHELADLPIKIAAAISRETLPKPPPLLSPCPPFATFALLAAREALLDAQLLPSDGEPPPYDPLTSGVSIGVGMTHVPDIIRAADHISQKAYRRVSPFLVPSILPNTPAGLVSLQHKLRGPTLAPATACAAGAHALADGFNTIRRGEAHIMLAGGAEAAIHPVTIAGFARARALAILPSSVPFDLHRSGFVLGEGAAVLVLESESHALSRNAKAYAELCGCGASGDAFHITSPSPDGSGAIRAMQAALRQASRDVTDVDYINAHATGTLIGDQVERTAISRLFPYNSETCKGNMETVVSSTKAATGHLLGAAGAVEAAFSVLALAEGVVPPTVGLENLDVDKRATKRGWGDLKRFVPENAIKKRVRFALSNSFGFGGTNACIAVGEVPDTIERRGIANVEQETNNEKNSKNAKSGG